MQRKETKIKKKRFKKKISVEDCKTDLAPKGLSRQVI